MTSSLCGNTNLHAFASLSIWPKTSKKHNNATCFQSINSYLNVFVLCCVVFFFLPAFIFWWVSVAAVVVAAGFKQTRAAVAADLICACNLPKLYFSANLSICLRLFMSRLVKVANWKLIPKICSQMLNILLYCLNNLLNYRFLCCCSSSSLLKSKVASEWRKRYSKLQHRQVCVLSLSFGRPCNFPGNLATVLQIA